MMKQKNYYRAIWLIEHDASHGWIRELREDAISGLKSLRQKIKLIEIPYTEYDNIEEILTKELNIKKHD